MDKKSINRIIQPAQFERAALERTVLDRGAIEHAGRAPANAMPHQFSDGGLQSREHAPWLAVDRNIEIPRRRSPALDLRFVIAGEKPVFLAKTRDPHRTKIFLEKAPRRG